MAEKHECGGCGGCGGGGHHPPQEPQKTPVNELSKVKKVIALAGGKGGTGKSLVTGLLAAGLVRQGKQVAILDADIGGPAIPLMFAFPQSVTRGEAGLYPAISDSGLKAMSISLITENEMDIITTRGAAMAGITEQLWTGVIWDEIDVLLIDLPPGLGDVTQFVFEQLPLDGVLAVTTPQEVANQAVRRTLHLAGELRVPVLGLVENFSESFGGTGAETVSREFQLPIIDSLPLDPRLSIAADAGGLEALETAYLANTIRLLADM